MYQVIPSIAYVGGKVDRSCGWQFNFLPQTTSLDIPIYIYDRWYEAKYTVHIISPCVGLHCIFNDVGHVKSEFWMQGGCCYGCRDR